MFLHNLYVIIYNSALRLNNADVVLFVSIDIGLLVVNPEATITFIPQESGDAWEIEIAVAVKETLASDALKFDIEFALSDGAALNGT